MKTRSKTLVALTLLCAFVATLMPLSAGAAVTVDKIYYNIDFEDAAVSSDSWPNKASSGLTFSYQSWASNVPYADSTQTVVTDATTGSKVMKLSIPKATTGVYYTGAAARGTSQNNPVTTDSFDNKVTWYELSFRYEGAVTPFNFVGVANTLFQIAADGTVHIGHGQASAINNFTPQVDKWYNLVIAVDNINKYKVSDTRHDTRFYAWINDELLLTGSENLTKCTITRPSSETTNGNQFLFGTPRSETTNVNMYFDNLKWYTSTEAVAVSGFDPTIKNGNYLPKMMYSMDFDSYSEFGMPQGLRKATRSVMGAGRPEEDLDDVSSVVVNAPADHFYRLKGKQGKAFFTDLFCMGINATDFSGDTVLQADYRISSSNTQTINIGTRDEKANGEILLYIKNDGYFYYDYIEKHWLWGNQTKTNKLTNDCCKAKWVNVAIAIHYGSNTYDIYINGTSAASGVKFKNSYETTNMAWIRYDYAGTTSDSDSFDMDNIWLYKADKYYNPATLAGVGGQYLTAKPSWTHEIDTAAISPNLGIFSKVTTTPMVNTTPRLTDFAEAKEAYKDAIAFVGGTKNVWIKDAKYTSNYETAHEGEHLLVAAPVLAAISNKSLSVSGDTATIGNLTATVGNSYITVGSTNVATSVKVKEIDGTIYIPLEEYAIYGMKKWYGASKFGFGVIANNERDIDFEVDANRPNLHTVGNTSHMMAYLIMDLPNATALSSKIASTKPASRPYIAGTPASFAALKQIVETDDTAKEYSRAVINNANSYTSSTAASSTVVWSLYWAYYMTGDNKYVVTAEAIANQLAALSDWSAYSHALTTSEKMVAAAYLYDLFYNKFSKTTLDALANAIINKGLNPFNEYYEGCTTEIHHDWCTRCSNWNAIPNSGVFVAASALLGEGYGDAVLTKSLERAFVSIGYFMPYFSPDGGAAEGTGYTAFTLGYMTKGIDALEQTFGTDFGLYDYPGFSNAGYFVLNSTSSTYHMGLNDDSAEGNTAPEVGLWFAKRNNDSALADYVMDFYDTNPVNKLAYSSGILKDYMPVERLDTPDVPLDALYTEAALGLSRDSFGPAATFMGVHGGYNHVSHGRYDFGTFRFDAFGKRFATSSGSDDYGLDSIGNFAYNMDYYTVRAEGHNVYVVNPDADPGQNRYTYGAPEIKDQKEKGIIYTLDMTPAYSADVKSAKRGYMLTNDRKVMVIQDEITPYGSNKDEFYWFWHTYADIQIDNTNKIVTLTRDNKKVKLYFDATVGITLSESAITPLSTSPNPSGQLTSSDYDNMKKIVARFTGNGQPIKFRVIAEPVGQSYTRGSLTAIDSWSIPSGSMDDAYYSKATKITANGIEIPKFNPDTLDYTMYYDGQMPTIAAESDGNITIVQASTSGDTAIVRIQDKENTSNYKIYTITLISRSEALGEVTTLVDCDFTDHPTLGGRDTASTGNFFLYHSKCGTQSFEIDPIRDSRVLRFRMRSADAANGGDMSDALVHMDRKLVINDTSTPGGLYFEFSFKADNYGQFTAQVYDQPLFKIENDGRMYVLYGRGAGAYDIGSYNLNEWYNIKIVYDMVDMYWGLHPRTYVYVNGNEYSHISTPFESDKWGSTYLGAVPNAAYNDLRFSFHANQSDEVNFYLDDVILYKTEKGTYGKVDVDSDLLGTDILSDKFSINAKDNAVYVPGFVTVKSLLDSIDPYTDSLVTVSKAGATVTDENKASTTALSGKLFVRSTTGKLIMPYDITTGVPGFDATWTLKKGDNKATAGSLSEIAAGDKIYLTSNVTNNTGVDKSATLVFAAYDGDSLIGVKTQPFTVKASNTTVVNIAEAIVLPALLTNLKVKAFIWEDLTKVKPVMNGHIFN